VACSFEEDVLLASSVVAKVKRHSLPSREHERAELASSVARAGSTSVATTSTE
jgi:hypothetical protein